jgi:hypothetical protein
MRIISYHPFWIDVISFLFENKKVKVFSSAEIETGRGQCPMKPQIRDPNCLLETETMGVREHLVAL